MECHAYTLCTRVQTPIRSYKVGGTTSTDLTSTLNICSGLAIAPQVFLLSAWFSYWGLEPERASSLLCKTLLQLSHSDECDRNMFILNALGLGLKVKFYANGQKGYKTIISLMMLLNPFIADISKEGYASAMCLECYFDMEASISDRLTEKSQEPVSRARLQRADFF